MRGRSGFQVPVAARAVTAGVALLATLGLPAGCRPAGEGGAGGDVASADTAGGREGVDRSVPEVEHLSSDDDALASLPFSEAARVGGLLFLSGQIGTVPGEGRLAEGGIGPETRQTMENIRAALERHGSSLERVVKCTAMLADIAEWEAMNEVYATFFPEGRRPARSAFGTSGLALGARVEIECIAAVGRV